MVNKPINFDVDEKKSLDQWAVTIMMPILEVISFVTLDLERQLSELN